MQALSKMSPAQVFIQSIAPLNVCGTVVCDELHSTFALKSCAHPSGKHLRQTQIDWLEPKAQEWVVDGCVTKSDNICIIFRLCCWAQHFQGLFESLNVTKMVQLLIKKRPIFRSLFLLRQRWWSVLMPNGPTTDEDPLLLLMLLLN